MLIHWTRHLRPPTSKLHLQPPASKLHLQPPRAVRRRSVGRLVDHRREHRRPDISCHRPLGGWSAGMPQKERKSCGDRPCCGSDFCGGFGDAAEPSLPFRYGAIDIHPRSPRDSHENSPRDVSRGRWPTRRRQKILYLRDDRGIGGTSAHSCEREGSDEGSDGPPKRARGHKGSAQLRARGATAHAKRDRGHMGSAQLRARGERWPPLGGTRGSAQLQVRGAT